MRHGLQFAGVMLLWLVGLNIDWDCLVPNCIMGSHYQWEFPLFFRPQRQSLCTALTAGNCLPLGLCKGTVKESSSCDIYLYPLWSDWSFIMGTLINIPVTSRDRHGIWNHWQLACLFNSFWPTRKISKLHIIDPLWGESTSDWGQ